MHAVVQPGQRIELTAPAGLREGDEVDVVLLTDDASEAGPPRALLDIIDALPTGIATFKSAKEVDEYVRNERDSWDR
jgi:hypothetical protein